MQIEVDGALWTKMAIKSCRGASLPALTLRAAHVAFVTVNVVTVARDLNAHNNLLLVIALAVAYMCTRAVDLLMAPTTTQLAAPSRAAVVTFATVVAVVAAWGHVPAWTVALCVFPAMVGLCLQGRMCWLPVYAAALVLSGTACLLGEWFLAVVLIGLTVAVVIAEINVEFGRASMCYELATSANALWPTLVWTMPLVVNPWFAIVVVICGGALAAWTARRTADALRVHLGVAELLGQPAGPPPTLTAGYDPAVNEECVKIVVVQTVIGLALHFLLVTSPLLGMTGVFWVIVACMGVIAWRVAILLNSDDEFQWLSVFASIIYVTTLVLVSPWYTAATALAVLVNRKPIPVDD